MQQKQAFKSNGNKVFTADLSLINNCNAIVEEIKNYRDSDFYAVVHCMGTLKPKFKSTQEGLDENITTSWFSRVYLSAKRVATDYSIPINLFLIMQSKIKS